jgi:hypothetical protein
MSFVIGRKEANKMEEAKHHNPAFDNTKKFARKTEALMDDILRYHKDVLEVFIDWVWTNKKKESFDIDFKVWDRSGKGRLVYNIFTGEYVKEYEIEVEWKDKDGKRIDHNKEIYEKVDKNAENPVGGLNWLTRKVDKYGKRVVDGFDEDNTYYVIFEGDRHSKYYRAFICTMYYLYEEVKIITSTIHEENLRPWKNRMKEGEFMRYCYIEDCQWIWDTKKYVEWRKNK